MARALVFVSAILAMVAFVSAHPHGALAAVNVGHVGTGDANVQKSLNDVVDAKNLHAHDIVQGVRVLSDGH